jgi:putative chitobiose transport system substrate-binding protein
MKQTIFLAALAALLCGCAKPAPQNEKTIEFWTIQLKPVFTDYMTALVSSYETTHPGVKVNWVDVPFTGIREKLMTAYLAGTPPDVINLNVDMAMSMAQQGALLDLNAAFPKEVRGDYLESAWNSTRIGNSVYAAPWYLASSITIYNKDLVQKAGLANVPGTFGELEAAGKQVKEKTGKYILCPKIGEDTDILRYFAMDGAPVFDGKRVHITDKASQDNMELWHRMFKLGYIPRAAAIDDHRTALNMFIRGETALFFSGPQFLKVVKENNPDLYTKVGVAPPIYGKSGVSDVDIMNIAVASASKHKAEAADFAAYVTNGPNQLAFCRLVAILPSVKSALNDPFFAQTGGDIEQQARHMAALSLLRTRPLTAGLTDLTQIQSIMQNAGQQAWMDKKSTADSLREAEDAINRLIAK